MPRLRTLCLVCVVGATAVTLRATDADAQVTPAVPPGWWPPPFIVWYPTPQQSPLPPPPAPRPATTPAARVPLPSLPTAPSASRETWPGPWSQMEDEVFVLTNERRAEGAVCGGQSFAPAGPLTPDPVLRSAAREHSRDMGEGNYFEHVSRDGRSPTDRMHAAGWSGRMGGENIYGGQKGGAPMTAAEVVQGWMDSPGHCVNIMNPRFKTLGVGFAAAPRSRLGNYWTQDFGG